MELNLQNVSIISQDPGRTCVEPAVTPIDNLSRLNQYAALKDYLGGKGCGLVRLKNIPGTPVPPAETISTDEYRKFVSAHGLEGRIKELDLLSFSWLKAVSGKDFEKQRAIENSIFEKALLLRRRFLTGKVPSETIEKLNNVFDNFTANGQFPVLMCRSSAVNEDGKVSMAGQHSSMRAITTKRQLIASWKAVCSSLFSDRAISYRLEQMRKQLESGSGDASIWTNEQAAMAAVVQPLIPAVSSGAVFTRRLADGRDAYIIEAVHGSGADYAEGKMTPSRWIATAEPFETLEWQAASQDLQKADMFSAGDSVQKHFDVREPPLKAEQVREIVGRVHCVLQHLRASDPEYCRDGIDLEYVVAPPGNLFFVQLRPETASIDLNMSNPEVSGVRIDPAKILDCVELGGEPGCLGAARGRLIIVRDEKSLNPEAELLLLARKHLKEGDVLVTTTTNIGWTPLFGHLGGIVTERGGVMSHTAIVAREMKKPAVIGCWGVGDALVKKLGAPAERLEDGKVLIFSEATLDANNCRLFQGRPDMTKGLLSDYIDPAISFRTADYYVQRTEFPHFVDESGVEWTGKPEYPMRRLQFELYYNGWQRAYDILNMSQSEKEAMPLQVSMALKDSSLKKERYIGTIRAGSQAPLHPEEYPVVAFPTRELAKLGDRIRTEGLRGKRAVLEQIFDFHEKRKTAFAEFRAFMSGITEGSVLDAAKLKKMCTLYSETIAYAHTRAAFRRRVAGPLRAEWLEKVPEAVRAAAGRLVTAWSNGLYTETTHRRDPEYAALLKKISSSSAYLMFTEKTVKEIIGGLKESEPAIMEEIETFASQFKLARAQSDHLENELPVEQLAGNLKDALLSGAHPSAETLFVRTSEGFKASLFPVLEMIRKEAPGFDTETFSRIMIMAREVAALTDMERHEQHRHQYRMLQLLKANETRLRAGGYEGPALFDLSVEEIVSLFNKTGSVPS